MQAKVTVGTMIVALSVLVAGCASMDGPDSAPELQAEITDVVQGAGFVEVSVIDNVATLSGMVDDELDSVQAEMVASNYAGVSEVINLITVDGNSADPSDGSGNADSADGDDGSGIEGNYEN